MPQNNRVILSQGPSGLQPIKSDANGNLLVVLATEEPAGVTPVSNSSGNVAAAAAVATLPAAAGKTTYLSHATITGAGATGASVVTAAITGLKGGTMSYSVPVPAGVAVGITPLNLTFDPPLPASAVNTAIVVTLPSLGAGNTNAAVSASGFQQ
jgi:hypothetical protein